MPGGVRNPLTEEGRARIRAWLPEAFATTNLAFDLFQKTMETHQREIQIFGNFPSLFMGLVTPDGTWEHYDGNLRFMRQQRQHHCRPTGPAEVSMSSSANRCKAPPISSRRITRPLGFPDGMYRVGPLARLNVCERMGVPQADAELKNFKSLGRGAVTSSFLYHYARLIEILAALEYIERSMDDPDLLSEDLRADAGINSLRGVGVSEAPRGTLFHDYTVDRDGLLQKVNLIVATGQNNLAMNQTVAQIARHYVRGDTISEPLLNRVEHGIRCFDPCLSCSTHAVGQMPLHIRLIGPTGAVLSEASAAELRLPRTAVPHP